MANQDFKPLADLLDGAREAMPEISWQVGTDTRPAKSSGVPLPRADNTFENFDLKVNPSMKAAYERCMKVARGEAWSAFLAGPPGNGKTHLAVAAMNDYGMLRSYFWKVPDYLDWLKDGVFEKNLTIEAITASYRGSAFLLVLDDLGVENQTDWAHEQLYRILDARYDLKLPTIITTNQPEKRLDPRLLSRYAEGLVVCRGKDVRRFG